MRGPESVPSSPNGFGILGGIFLILFGLFFLIPLYFPYMAIDLIIDEGINPRTIGFLILFIVIAAPFVAGGLFSLAIGFSGLTGRDLMPKRRKSRPRNRRRRRRGRVVFGGGRSAIGPVFLSMLFLPFLIFLPIGVLYGIGLLLSGGIGSEACLIIPVCILFTLVSYSLVSSAIAKRKLIIDQNNGIIFYQTLLFGLRIGKEIRPLIEALEVREWKTYTEGGNERIHCAILGEGQEVRWAMDISMMTQTNFIEPEKIALALGVPHKHGKSPY